jgi:mono/diheme cytochrome c family protein
MFSRERMLLALQYGRPGTAMTAWTTQLSTKEMEAVVDYIRETMMAPEPGSPLARGRALYGHHCIACHGERGEGIASSPSHPAPRPFARDADRAQMLASVSQGRFGSLKHEFAAKLKPEEIGDTVDYVRKALAPALLSEISGTRAHGGRGRDKDKEGAVAAVAAMPEGLSGDAGRGRRLYEQNCVACHGAAGDGKGPRSALLDTKVRDFAESSYNRPALYAAIAGGRAGTDMPAWRAVLDRQQIADVAEYVWRTHFRSPKAARAER